jgi:formylglycine-generating enzyme required for sulfatase activity
MIQIPAGEFTLGCSPRDGACVDDATRFAALDVPARRIHLPDFWIDRTEVTREEYGRCVRDGGCTPIEGTPWNGIAEPDLPNLPASGVDWDQAHAFCEWRGARLPTEAEWEKAARGPHGARYPWGDSEPVCGQANVRIRDEACATSRQVEPVDRRPADISPYGVLGMAGNAQEWTSDWLGPDYSALSAQEPDSRFPDYRIVRGSYFDMGPRRVSWRSFAPETVRSVGRIGFRCASSSHPPDSWNAANVANHGLPDRSGVFGFQRNPRILGREDPKNLVGEPLSQRLDVPEVENHLAELVEVRDEPLRFRSRDIVRPEKLHQYPRLLELEIELFRREFGEDVLQAPPR